MEKPRVKYTYGIVATTVVILLIATILLLRSREEAPQWPWPME